MPRPSMALVVGLACLLVLVPAGAAGAKPGKGRGQQTTVRYGPFTIPASTGMQEGVMPGDADTGRMLTRRLVGVPKPCDDCSITGFRANLTYADGASANFDTDVMLHHLVMSNASARDLTCPTRAQRFFASGNERTPVSLPRKFGYPVRSPDRWNVLVELMNMAPRAQTVYVDVKFTVVRGRMRSVTPAWLDLGGCGGSQYSIPAGRSSETRDWRPAADYRVVSIGGHQHDGGRFIQVNNATRRQLICRSVAGYGTNPSYMGHLESMSTCSGKRLAVVRQGDVVRLKSVYVSPEARDDVMGITLGYLAPLKRR